MWERAKPTPTRFEVIVGNIGRVYEGTKRVEAMTTYANYLSQSKSGTGRAGNESIALLCDGHVILEHVAKGDEL